MKKFFIFILPILLFSSEINWEINFDKAVKKAKKLNKPIMVFYESYDCKWCDEMLKSTFKNKKVVDKINSMFVSVKIFKDKKDYPSFIYSKLTPTTFFILPEGKNIIRPVLGYWDVESFLSYIEDAERKLKNRKQSNLQ